MARGKMWQVEVEQDERPSGSVLFGDPSYARMTRHVTTWNDPRNIDNAVGEQHGIDSLSPEMIPYHDRTLQSTGENAWRQMARKKGVLQEEPED